MKFLQAQDQMSWHATGNDRLSSVYLIAYLHVENLGKIQCVYSLQHDEWLDVLVNTSEKSDLWLEEFESTGVYIQYIWCVHYKYTSV